MTSSVSKLPSMPIFTMRPSLTRCSMSALKRFFVPVMPVTQSCASSAVKLLSCSAVMQMQRWMGTTTRV